VDGKIRKESTSVGKLRIFRPVVDRLKAQLIGLLCLTALLLW
jgi:hypothetical protein